MRLTVAVLDKQANNVVDRLLGVLDAVGAKQARHFGLLSPQKGVLDKSLGLLSRQGINSSTAIAYFTSQSKSASSYEFLQLNEAAILFEGRLYSPVEKTAVLEQISKEPRHCETALQTLVEKTDGDYSFLMIKNGWIAAGRDPVGVQPLYYGENKDLVGIATNCKALWKLGIENPVSFPPGNLGFADRNGFEFKPVKTLTYAEPRPIKIDEAAKKLRVLLEESIKRRTRDLKEVVVAFSGGLDSSIVAYLASKFGVKVNLIHVSMENQLETEEAIQASDELCLPLQVHLFKDSDVEEVLPLVVELIEEPDPIKASVGLPFYWTAEKAAEAGFRVVLAGQGADELFGGYQRYVNEYCTEGKEKVLKTMFHDVINIHKSNLERDLKITSYQDIELRLPFASFDLAKLALSLPIECKIEQKHETLRKLVLRKVALDAGMPSSVVDKPKKAVQYSTGVNDAIKRIAKKHHKSVNEYITELLQKSKD